MGKASTNQTIFSSKPLCVTACFFPANKSLNRLKTVSIVLSDRFAQELLPRRIGSLDLFLRAGPLCASRQPLVVSKSS